MKSLAGKSLFVELLVAFCVVALIALAEPLAAQDDPPSIITQPESQTVLVGDSFSFSVVVTDPDAASYQWRKNGSNLSDADGVSFGATEAAYSKYEAVVSDAGLYTVKITNSAGAITSAVATLTVLVPPAITTQPQSKTVIAGSNVTLFVKATGSAPLGYQWFVDNVEIPGATATNLTLLNVQPGQEGDYTVAVTNAAHSL